MGLPHKKKLKKKESHTIDLLSIQIDKYEAGWV